MDKNNTLGEVLKTFRLKAFPDIGLRRVASEVGIDYAHLFRIESGQYIPSDDTLIKILDAYKITDPSQKLEAFHLARLTPSYQEVINKAVEQGTHKAVVGVFYRKDAKKKNNKK